jgi:predicted transcriptional regulator
MMTTNGQQILDAMMTWPVDQFEAGLAKLNMRPEVADMLRVNWITMNEDKHADPAVRAMLTGVVARFGVTAETVAALLLAKPFGRGTIGAVFGV